MNIETIEKRISTIIFGAKTREQVFNDLKEYLPRHEISDCYLKNYYWLNDSEQVNIYSGNNKEVKIFKNIITELRKKDVFLKKINFYLMITTSLNCTYKLKILHNFVY